jgi:hypothetical protein
MVLTGMSSSLAARMKSKLVSPPTACVLTRNSTSLKTIVKDGIFSNKAGVMSVSFLHPLVNSTQPAPPNWPQQYYIDKDTMMLNVSSIK